MVHILVIIDPAHQVTSETLKSKSAAYWHQILQACQRPHVAFLVASLYALLCRAQFFEGSPTLYYLPVPAKTAPSFVPTSILHHFTDISKQKNLLSLSDRNIVSFPVYAWGQPEAKTPTAREESAFAPANAGDEGPAGIRVMTHKSDHAFLFIGPQHSVFAVQDGTQSVLMPTSRFQSFQIAAREDTAARQGAGAR